MTASYKRMNLRRQTARFAIYITIFATSVVAGRAQTPPYVQFQSSTLTGAGNTISVTRLPVVLTTGAAPTYEDVTILFEVDSQGNLTIAPGFPQFALSPSPIASRFRPGTYVGPSTTLSGKAMITVSGPSLGPGGTTEWTITAPIGADPCTYPSSATWYVGPLASNPQATRLQKAGITSTAYSYGIGSSQCSTDGDDWAQNTLIGLSQVGPSLTIYSYTYHGGPTNGGTDYPTAQDQITYCLVGSPNCPTAQ